MQLLETVSHLFHPGRTNNHRPSLLHPENIFGLLFVALGLLGAMSVSPRLLSLLPESAGIVLGYATNISADQVIAITNAKRQEAGLAPLAANEALAQAAAGKAADMFAKQYWAHVSPSGTQPWDFIRNAGYAYQAAGENLGRDFMGSGELVDAWMASPTHRANIVNARYQEIGVAVVNGTLEGVETTLVVQMFGRPRSAASAVSGQAVAVVSEPAAAVPQAAAPRPTVQPTPRTVVSPEPVPSVAPQPTALPAAPSTVTTEPVAIPGEEAVLTAPTPESSAATQNERQSILPAMTLIGGTLQTPVVSPRQLQKSVVTSVVLLVVLVLLYDWLLLGKRRSDRIVGLNIAHILYLLTVLSLVLTFRSGGIL